MKIFVVDPLWAADGAADVFKYERSNITVLKDDGSDPDKIPTRDNIVSAGHRSHGAHGVDYPPAQSDLQPRSRCQGGRPFRLPL